MARPPDPPSNEPLLDTKKSGASLDGRALFTAEREDDAAVYSLFSLFRYASRGDLFLLFLGTLVAVASGVGLPLSALVLGDLTQLVVDASRIIESSVDQHGNSTLLEPLEDTVGRFESGVARVVWHYSIIGVMVFIASTIQEACFLAACENMAFRCRRAFMQAVLAQDMAWFDSQPAGAITTQMFDNLERMREGTGDKLGLLIQYTAQFVAGVGFAFYFDWKLTAVMMSFVPVLILAIAMLNKMIASSTVREAKSYSRAGEIAEEVFSAVRTVFSFNAQDFEVDRYNKALERAERDGKRKTLYVSLGQAITKIVLYTSYAVSFWVGTMFVADGALSPKYVLTVFFSVMMGSLAMGTAGPQFAALFIAKGACQAVYRVIDRKPSIFSRSPSKLPDFKGEIEFDGVSFAYPTRKDVPVLKSLSLSVPACSTVAVVGASGCGKSTLAQLLLRFYQADRGKISIGSVDIRSIPLPELRARIGTVSQEPALFNTTIEENLLFARPTATLSDIEDALRRANALDFVRMLPKGLQTPVGNRGAQLSGGQKQRISIARALLRHPDILILDEATSALDADSEREVQKALEQVSTACTTLVIAHRLSTVRGADRIVAIRDGTIVESGTHNELMAKQGYYYDLVKRQVFVDVEGKGEGEVEEKEQEEEQADMEQHDAHDSTSLLTKQSRTGLSSIFRLAREEWGVIAAGLIFSVLQGCVNPLFSLMYSEFIAIFAHSDPERMLSDGRLLSLAMLVMGVAVAATIFMQSYTFGVAAESLTRRMRVRVFSSILAQDVAFFDRPTNSPGRLSTRLATDAPMLKSAIDYRLGSVLSALVAIACAICICVYCDWRMALLMSVLFPITIVGQYVQIQFTETNTMKESEQWEEAGKMAVEAIDQIRTVQCLGLEGSVVDRFTQHLLPPLAAARRRAKWQGLAYGFSNGASFVMYSASFKFGAWLIQQGMMLPNDMIKCVLAISITSGSIGYAAAYFPEAVKARAAARLILAQLRLAPAIPHDDRSASRQPIAGALSLASVSFRYAQRPQAAVLDRLDLDIDKGATVALVGASGCGKSTVLALLQRYYDPTSGVVSVDGVNAVKWNASHVRASIGVVGQEPVLFDRSIKDNIAYGLREVSREKVVEAATAANIHAFVAVLPEGYSTRVGDKGTQLSGGQKQRIALARALLRDPRILLLDEATSALDADSEKVVQQSLDAAASTRTCVVVAHRLSTVRNADRICVFKDGSIVEQGTHSELMEKRGVYFDLVHKQSGA